MVSPTRTEPNIYEEIVGLQEQSHYSTCTVGTILAQVDDETRDGLVRALADPSIKGTLITEVLKARGFRLSSRTLQRHRRGACGCSKASV